MSHRSKSVESYHKHGYKCTLCKRSCYTMDEMDFQKGACYGCLKDIGEHDKSLSLNGLAVDPFNVPVLCTTCKEFREFAYFEAVDEFKIENCLYCTPPAGYMYCKDCGVYWRPDLFVAQTNKCVQCNHK